MVHNKYCGHVLDSVSVEICKQCAVGHPGDGPQGPFRSGPSGTRNNYHLLSLDVYE